MTVSRQEKRLIRDVADVPVGYRITQKGIDAMTSAEKYVVILTAWDDVQTVHGPFRFLEAAEAWSKRIEDDNRGVCQITTVLDPDDSE
jgi:hypothetical protein